MSMGITLCIIFIPAVSDKTFCLYSQAIIREKGAGLLAFSELFESFRGQVMFRAMECNESKSSEDQVQVHKYCPSGGVCVFSLSCTVMDHTCLIRPFY